MCADMSSVTMRPMPTRDHRDRVLDWREELLRIGPELAALPSAARLAILEVLADFIQEDVEAGRELAPVVGLTYAAAA
jgi:hypothetical protein